MTGKRWLLGGSTVIVLVAIIFVADYSFNIPILRSLPGVRSITCQRSVIVRGNAMAPTIPDGTRVSFNQCLDEADRRSLTPGTIILYEQFDSQRVARVTDRKVDESGVGYTTKQDNRPETSDVRSDRIIGVKVD